MTMPERKSDFQRQSDVDERLSSSSRDSAKQAQDKAGNTPRRGADVKRVVAVTLREAYCGTTRSLRQQLASGRERPLELKIPPGVDTGTRVRFTGYGLSGHA